MTHLELEEIAKFAEGNVSKTEYEKFIKHITKCEKCRKIYSTTLTFVEKERTQKKVLRLSSFQKAASCLLQYAASFFANKRLKPVFAVSAILLILLTVTFIFYNGGYTNAQVQSVKERFLGPNSNRGFSGSPDKISSALRAGIFIEDLSLAINHAKEKDLKTKIGMRLFLQIKNISKKEAKKLFPKSEDAGYLKKVIKNIEEFMERNSLIEPFLFGRFLERSFLDTFKDKRPLLKDIERFQPVALNLKLSTTILKDLEKLKTVGTYDDIRDICEDIEKIFFL
jgi:hypothetical protein